MSEVIDRSLASLRDRVREATSAGTALRITGAGTWLDAGRPTGAREPLSSRDLSGILAYVPGDLTLTARSGTSLAELRAATAEHGQWLALDPFGNEDGTLGATLATGSAGPLATSFGTPRDLTLGVEVLTGEGSLVRGGGRVVKNVAGFDLTRLFIGSWGTLGIITEATMRLHARPQCDETVAVVLGEREDVARTRALLRRATFTPYACEIVNGDLARLLLGTDQLTALFRLGGNDESVRAQRIAISELGEARTADPAIWLTLRTCEPAQAITFRFSNLPSQVGQTWHEASTIAEACAGTLLHATPARGVVRCIVPPADANVAWLQRAFQAPTMTTCVAERLPAQLWSALSPAVNDPISAGIRRAFNASAALNPGILGEVA